MEKLYCVPSLKEFDSFKESRSQQCLKLIIREQKQRSFFYIYRKRISKSRRKKIEKFSQFDGAT